ncbi:unnamed protein product [Trichogramma brassicae]|uniref:CCHC-type domain-containing protein n=1 Tax=Trichogramma brassicae TaxID=86971 RepID=A0A6H5IX80_9HYME|nr:unnamed protein product [Trichogramma brassicae]
MPNINEAALQAVEEVIRLEEQQQQGAVSRQLAAAVAETREQQQRVIDGARRQAPPDVEPSEQSVAAAASASVQEVPTAWWVGMEVDNEVEVAMTRQPESTAGPRPRGPPMTPSPPPLSMRPSAVKSRARRAKKINPNRQWTVDDLESAVGDISLPKGNQGAALSINSYSMQPTPADSVERSSVPASSSQLPPPPALPSSGEPSDATAGPSQPPLNHLSSGEQHNVPAVSWDLPMDQSGPGQQSSVPASPWELPAAPADDGRHFSSVSPRKRTISQAAKRASGAAAHQHQGVASGRVGKTQKRRDRRHRLQERLANGEVPGCQVPRRKEKREIRHGVFFGELARVAIDDSIDPPDGTCFRCWQPGHRAVDCRSGLDERFCGNCGRSGRYTVECERCGARARLMLDCCYQRGGEPRRAASDHSQFRAVAMAEERRTPPAAPQEPPAASWQREPQQQRALPQRQQALPEQYRAPQLSELEMFHRVMERQAQIEVGRVECQRALQEVYALELIYESARSAGRARTINGKALLKTVDDELAQQREEIPAHREARSLIVLASVCCLVPLLADAKRGLRRSRS